MIRCRCGHPMANGSSSGPTGLAPCSTCIASLLMEPVPRAAHDDRERAVVDGGHTGRDRHHRFRHEPRGDAVVDRGSPPKDDGPTRRSCQPAAGRASCGGSVRGRILARHFAGRPLLAYESSDSGRREVYVRPFPHVNGGRWQVSTMGGHALRGRAAVASCSTLTRRTS